MNELVVGLDGSDNSRMALRWAAAVGQAAGVPVRAVQSWVHTRAVVLQISPPLLGQVDEGVREATAEIVESTLGSPGSPGSPGDVKVDVLRGEAAGALLRTVTPDSVLVLGSRGGGGFKGLLLGSVSQECVEYASCPVVVVRSDRPPGDGADILVGKDGSEGAQWALAWAQALATETGASVRAVHAWRASESERPPGRSERLRARAAATVEGWTQEIAEDIESEEMEGDPRAVLVRAAEELEPVLTVVGRRGAGGLRSMRLGSTANHLVRHSSTNVAVVPAPDGPDPAAGGGGAGA